MVSLSEVSTYIEELYSVTVSDHSGDLMELGVIDSMMAIELLSHLETKFVVKFPFTEYTKDGFFTIDSITESLNRIKQACS